MQKLRIRAVRSVFGPRTKSQKVTSGIETVSLPYSVALWESRAASILSYEGTNPPALVLMQWLITRLDWLFAKALALPKAAHDDHDDDDTTCRDSNTAEKQTFRLRLSYWQNQQLAVVIATIICKHTVFLGLLASRNSLYMQIGNEKPDNTYTATLHCSCYITDLQY